MSVSTRPENTRALAEGHSLLDELVCPVATATARHRLRIIDRITDPFAAGSRSYSHEQIALFDDVLRRLCIDIEVKARAKLAERLAGMHSAPPKLVRSFAFDDAIEVAGPLLVRSQQLTDNDLVENATTKSQDHPFAIAQRPKFSEAVTDLLVDRRNERFVQRGGSNNGEAFSRERYAKLTNRAQYDRKLTLALGARSDIPRQYFLKLLESASATVRARLEAANPEAVAAVRDSIDESGCKEQGRA